MKRFVVAVTIVPLIALAAGGFRAAADIAPLWAHPVNASGFPPAMPDIVSRGRKPDVPGCGSCHLVNGFGRPENASLAGLPAVYIAQQMADYRRGVRKSSEPRMGASVAMAAIGKAADEAEVQAASEYFASIAFKPWTRVVEVDTVPKTRVSNRVFVQVDGGGSEPIGSRVVEVPADRTRAELRDAASGYVAYVPVGSIKRGEALVTTGAAGRTVRCALCHGEDLKGLRSVPGLAGRSPSYVVRQLYEMQHGARHGLGADLMKATVERLNKEDMLSIAAYTASRAP
jgi:cytochrome c553